MVDRRKSPRSDLEQIAFISAAGGSVRCVVVNASADGAAIDVPNAAYLPNGFRLMTESNRIVRNCRIAWVKGNRIGVEFVDVRPIKQRERQFMQYLCDNQWVREAHLPASQKTIDSLLHGGLIERSRDQEPTAYRLTPAGITAKEKPVKIRHC
ncbi:PilZ domain-containing protein [Bradyrhizobium sp. LTSPM299]|uniref:PilZ domain-containing protein n=1 Tax=Bradyrhizobium sp. LTSPM299 TaxID=1619233 RepID=UPI0009E5A9AC|nr:PilZ domain-containing protein [Bradyrhizobium sp. LTSPM299]